jgi:hypothetical protein
LILLKVRDISIETALAAKELSIPSKGKKRKERARLSKVRLPMLADNLRIQCFPLRGCSQLEQQRRRHYALTQGFDDQKLLVAPWAFRRYS